MVVVILQNIWSLLKRSKRLFVTYALCMMSIFIVFFTVYSVIGNLVLFFSESSTNRYLIEFEVGVSSDEIEGRISELDRQMNQERELTLFSYADPENHIILIGKDAPLETDYFSIGDIEGFKNIGSMERAAVIDLKYVDVYNRLDIGCEAIKIQGEDYSVIAAADLFQAIPWGIDYHMTFPISLTSADGGKMPLYNHITGDDFYDGLLDDEICVPVMISVNNLLELEVPIQYVHVKFSSQPSYPEYQGIVSSFSDISLYEIPPYETPSLGGNIASTMAVVCAAAVVLALSLSQSITYSVLDSRLALWRGLYLMGCSRRRLRVLMLAETLALCLVAGALGAIFSRLVIGALLPVNAAAPLYVRDCVGVGALGVVMMCAACLPAIARVAGRASGGGRNA